MIFNTETCQLVEELSRLPLTYYVGNIIQLRDSSKGYISGILVGLDSVSNKISVSQEGFSSLREISLASLHESHSPRFVYDSEDLGLEVLI